MSRYRHEGTMLTCRHPLCVGSRCAVVVFLFFAGLSLGAALGRAG